MNHVKSLLRKHLHGELNEEEQIALNTWLAQSPGNKVLFDELNDPLQIAEALDKMDQIQEQQVWERLKAYSASRIEKIETEGQLPHRTKRLKRMQWSAAAAILIMLAAGSYFFLIRHPAGDLVADKNTRSSANDIGAPKTTNAIITLAGGKQIILDSAGKGMLALQEHVNIEKMGDGAIVYKGSSDKIMYNTLTNPRGSKVVSLTLADGTRVWLNSESTITYPTAFTGKGREVEMTGEAYFEIAKNALQPFTVKVGNQLIEDIGTRFNINAYHDEPAVRTTLIEGSVKVIHDLDGVILKPGQQASLANGSNIILVSPANGEAAIAWKNGVFELTNADVASILRQISRWYDVGIKYKGAVPKGTISGGVPRNLNLSEVLKALAISGIHCELQERTLTVFE